MMRIRPFLKRFTRKKKKYDTEIQHAEKKSLRVKLRALTKRFKSRKKDTRATTEDGYNSRNSNPELTTTEDDPGYVTVHVNADPTDSIVAVETPTEDTEPVDKTEGTDKIEPRESVANALHPKESTETESVTLLRVPDASTDIEKRQQRRSLDQLISDRTSGISTGSPLWTRKHSDDKRTASNISVYSKQLHDQIETRTVWTQTEKPDNVKNETVERKVGPSPAGSLDVKLEDIGVGPSPAGSLDVKLENVGVGPSPCGSTDFGIESKFPIERVENAKLARMKTRILNRLDYPNLDACDANICVELLRFPKLPFLIALNRKLSLENALFNVEFLELNGLDYLLALMDLVSEDGLSDIRDVVMMLELSECATSVVNSNTAKEYLVTHGERIISVARGR